MLMGQYERTDPIRSAGVLGDGMQAKGPESVSPFCLISG